ncbi:MAG: leucine-rich repeat protein, partial [Lachnospiraceae bacterium]|nr:leucine-rich repeat protein [Lachnospiraceae bacterium]
VSFTAPADTKVTSVTIPATVTVGGKTMKVTVIEAGAFSKCKKLKTVTIGKNVTQIRKNAFKGCKKIKTVKVKSKKLKKVGNGAFKNLAKNARIYLPKSKKSKYKKLFTKKVIGSTKLKWN